MNASGRSDSVVAVLERRGRFLTAEPLFAPGPAGGPGNRGRAAGIVVGQARSARALGGAREGEIVLVRPAGRGSPARVQRRIGRPDVARDVIEALMIDRGLRHRFGEVLEQEAEAAAARVASTFHRRRDLRELATFTIDPVSARDFDDAISAEELGAGRARVWVHIADVAAHVAEGSKLDREARRRSTSVYAPGTVEPMLPHVLSSDACSLRTGAERPAVTVELELDGPNVLRTAFYRSLIRSDERLDYDQVDRIFAGTERALDPWAEPLSVARAVAAALQREREASGAVVVESPEAEFQLDDRGDVVAVKGEAQTESHRLIEHLMIAANEAVARLLSQQGVPCLYRVHERPDPARIEHLVAQLASLEVPTPPLPDQLSPSQAIELLGEISRRVQDYLKRRHGRGRLGIGSLVLRSLKQAYYSPVNLGHSGLRSSAYCHFTSPIRRYPDIVCHRALLSTLGEPERPPRAGELSELGTWTSDREREAMVLERDADDVAGCFFLERLLRKDPGQVLTGETIGLISAGAFIAFAVPGGPGTGPGEAPPFEGMLPVRLLRAPRREPVESRGRGNPRGRAGPAEPGREWWELNEEGTILRGERTGAALRLGDEVQVRVARIDAIRGRVDLEPAG